MMNKICNRWKILFSYKDALQNLVFKEIKVRYLGAILGFAWSFGNPVLFTVTYYIVFTYIFPSHQPHFALFIVIGVLHWNLFYLTIAQSSEMLTSNAGLIKKLYFPKIIVPFSNFAVNLIFWLAGAAIFFIMYPFLGGIFSFAMLIYPLILILYLLFIWGAGLVLSIAYVKFRDLKHLIDVFLQLLFWMTPIVYLPSQLSANIRYYLQLNPMSAYIEAFHAIFYYDTLPSSDLFFKMLFWSGSLITIGYLLFKRKADYMVEYL